MSDGLTAQASAVSRAGGREPANTARGELTLLLPGLAGPDVPGDARATDDGLQAARALTEALQLPGLSGLLEYARATDDAFVSATADGMLAEAFNMPLDGDGQWCAGAVARQGALGDASDRYWMRADPVHLRADMGRLLVFPPSTLGLTLADSSAICEWLNAHEHFPGPQLAAISGTCWLLEVDEQSTHVRTCAPSLVHGQDADRFLPAGEGAVRWHARMNEIQMLLDQCPINRAREARGEPTVNSVWFWGAGALPTQATAGARAPYAQVHGNHELLAGLAAGVGLHARALPLDGARWLADGPLHDRPVSDQLLQMQSVQALAAQRPRVSGAHLLVLEDLQLAACAADISAWQLALHALDRQWLQPLVAALRRGAWQQITLHAGRGASVVIRRAGLARWLRRRCGLAESLARLRQTQARKQATAR